MKFIGFDTATPGGEITEIRVPSRQAGKTAAMNAMIDKCLDAGQTVLVITPDGCEKRGAETAKDVTPKMKLLST